MKASIKSLWKHKVAESLEEVDICKKENFCFQTALSALTQDNVVHICSASRFQNQD